MSKNIVRCCFAGHSDMYCDDVVDSIKSTAKLLIENFDVCEFWVGNYGSFDKYCARVMQELKARYTYIKICLVIPYLTEEINLNSDKYAQKFDEIILADIDEKTPRKYRIIKSNEYMVDNSSFLICYIHKTWGGAARTYDYAKRKNLKIYNIKT